MNNKFLDAMKGRDAVTDLLIYETKEMFGIMCSLSADRDENSFEDAELYKLYSDQYCTLMVMVRKIGRKIYGIDWRDYEKGE